MKMQEVYKNPSFYAHALVGILTLVACIILFRNIKDITSLDTYKLVVLILLFTIAIGIHGLSHLGLEHTYQYNPLRLKMLEHLQVQTKNIYDKSIIDPSFSPIRQSVKTANISPRNAHSIIDPLF